MTQLLRESDLWNPFGVFRIDGCEYKVVHCFEALLTAIVVIKEFNLPTFQPDLDLFFILYNAEGEFTIQLGTI